MSVLEGLKLKANGSLGTIPLDDAGEAGGCKTVMGCSGSQTLQQRSSSRHEVLANRPLLSSGPQLLAHVCWQSSNFRRLGF